MSLAVGQCWSIPSSVKAMTWPRRILLVMAVGFVSFPVVLGVSGYLLFTKASMDPLGRADAIVVLGGEHDGRVAYGLSLAAQGYADTVLLSDPYGPRDSVMRDACAASNGRVTVVCFNPSPSTTRGEARFTQEMATRHGWSHVIVVTWRYHLPRARFIFHQCFDGTVAMRGVPRAYDFSIAKWESVYAYQLAGMVKAAAIGC